MTRLCISLSLLVLLASNIATAQRCTVRGTGNVDRVRIAPQGSEAFELDLSALAVEVSAARDGVRVRTTGALRFEGTASSSAIELAVAGEARLAGVIVRPGTPLERTFLEGAGARADALIANGVTLSDARIPCARLRVGPAAEAPAHVGGPTRGTLMTIARTLEVRARPRGPSSTLELDGELLLAEIAREGEWVHVRRDFFAGSTIDGWVRVSDVRSVPEEEFSELGVGIGHGGLGLCGRAGGHVYRGPATLLAGSEIRTSPDGPAWARAAQDVPIETVEIAANATWAALVSIPGIRGHGTCPNLLETAWAPAAALRLPTP